ncbi:MAG: VWA domain-containing protein, partial [Saprospiraceae bacterium]|nr:VWA domain-containing protein [Saprospiraceae bacterium]
MFRTSFSTFIYPIALLLGVIAPQMAQASISPSSANLSGAVGTEVTLEFTVGAADGDCTWSIVPTNSTTPLTAAQLNSAGLSFATANGGEQITVRYRPAAAHSACPSVATYRLMAAPVAGGSSFFSTMNLCKKTLETVVKPIEVVIVADVSGSMGEVAICDCGAGPRATTEPCTATENAGGETKMTYLKRELNAAMTVLKPYFSDAAGQNKVALVTFEDIPHLEQGLTAFNAVDLTAKINGLMPLGVTAMGEGIRMAANQFSPNAVNADDDPIRVILLFTNGMQNAGDQVSVSGGNVMIGATALNSIRRNIKIIPYAIFTPEGTYAQTLRDMASANGMSSDNLTTTPYICQIDRPLRQNWVNSADALGSPKMVHFTSNTTSNKTGTETFAITENLENLAVGVSLNQNAAIQSLKIEKMVAGVWTDITSKGVMTPGGVTAAYQAVHFKYPLAGVGASASGDYRVTLGVSQNVVSYDVSAVVDDKGLKDYFFNSPLLGAGEQLYLGTHLLQKAVTPTPVTNATVNAIIYKPKKSLNNGFA